MNDYLLTEDLARERYMEAQRFQRVARRIAEAEKAGFPRSQASPIARIGQLLGGLLSSSLGIARPAAK